MWLVGLTQKLCLYSVLVWNTILCFSSLLHYPEHAAEDDKRQGPGGSGCAILAQSGVVSKTSKHADINPSAAREDILQLPMDLRAKRHLRKHLRLLIRKISRVVSEAQVFLCVFLNRLSQFCVHQFSVLCSSVLSSVFIVESRDQEPVCNVHQQMDSLSFQKTH